MKKFLLTFLFSTCAFAQCFQSGNISATGASASFDNSKTRCSQWTLNVMTSGPIAQYSTTLQGDFGSGFTTLSTVSGSNPCTIVTSCSLTYSGVPPISLRLNTTTFNSVPTGGFLQYSLSGSSPAPPLKTIVSVYFSQTQTVTINNVTSEKTVTGAGRGSLILPSNTFQNPGDFIRVHWIAVISDNNAMSGLTFKPKLGGQTLVSSTYQAYGTNDHKSCIMDLTYTAQTVGKSGTISAGGSIYCFDTTDADGGLDWSGLNPDDGTAPSLTIDTTTTNAIDFTVTPSDALWAIVTSNFDVTGYQLQ